MIDPGDTRTGGGARARALIVKAGALLVLAAIVGVVVLALTRSGGDGGTTAKNAPSAARELSGTGAELAALVAKSRTAEYHAKYRVAGDSSKGSAQIELWRKDGLIRQEETIESDEGSVRTAAFQLADRTVICSRSDADPWQCGPGPAGGVPVKADAFVDHLASQLDGKSVERVKSDEFLGQKGQCFEIGAVSGNDSSEICVTSSGIPLALRSGPARLEIVELEMKVEDAAFVPPADDPRVNEG